MEDAGWDPFEETHRLVDDLTALSGAPLIAHTKVRLGLLLYSHVTEVGAMYDVLANLACVAVGERDVIDPFLAHRKGARRFVSTPTKVDAVRKMLADAGHSAVAEAIDWFFHASIRNAFAHADYTLAGDRLCSRSELFSHGGIRSPELHLDVIAEVVNRALVYYDVFVSEYVDQRRSYRASKIVMGGFARGLDPAPIELLADETHRLYGFRSPPGGTPTARDDNDKPAARADLG